MEIRHISETYHVSPQITAEDVAELAKAGFTTIICNRPDAEVPPMLRADMIGTAAEAAGLDFHVLPITHQSMTPDAIRAQAGIVEAAPGNVLAYCASGTRSTVLWSLDQAMSRKQPVDDILNAAQQAGYDLGGLRQQLEMLSAG
ncbi:TIGR01244 family sulfur transferase [Primorskyibacter aestuariivivens]|uniref:TIGR01244 family sulfur transferase n=1 Tax=Primorskyibacter aestuariivivens TaxID=1888912 RepID=UPI002300EB7E|nr:TIGR01244 family sulfur transferase [Primorskyibacter aestuariivivens]MDA7427188.1 TIGR01244 family sulfur transferase [Primorskyibacter aestuariivivens]